MHCREQKYVFLPPTLRFFSSISSRVSVWGYSFRFLTFEKMPLRFLVSTKTPLQRYPEEININPKMSKFIFALFSVIALSLCWGLSSRLSRISRGLLPMTLSSAKLGSRSDVRDSRRVYGFSPLTRLSRDDRLADLMRNRNLKHCFLVWPYRSPQ